MSWNFTCYLITVSYHENYCSVIRSSIVLLGSHDLKEANSLVRTQLPEVLAQKSSGRRTSKHDQSWWWSPCQPLQPHLINCLPPTFPFHCSKRTCFPLPPIPPHHYPMSQHFTFAYVDPCALDSFSTLILLPSHHIYFLWLSLDVTSF